MTFIVEKRYTYQNLMQGFWKIYCKILEITRERPMVTTTLMIDNVKVFNCKLGCSSYSLYPSLANDRCHVSIQFKETYRLVGNSIILYHHL